MSARLLLMLNPLTAEFLWQRFTHFYLTWFCWQPVLHNFSCCHQTYNYSRPPWSAPPGKPPLVTWNHAHSGAPPLILDEPPNFTRFAITAWPCSHKVHSWGVAVRGHWPPSKVTNLCILCPCRSHTSTTMKVRGCAPSNPAERGTPPCAPPPGVHFSAGGVPKTRGFFLKVCSTYLVIFTHLNRHFLRVVFQVSGTVYVTKTRQ